MVGRVVVTTDVSARKVNADLEKAKEAAEAANQAKSAFFASMSHELRTPLNHIIGYSEMLMEDAELNQHSDLYAQDLKKVHDAGKTLLHIISQVLALAKLEAGQVSIQPEEFALDSLIEDICIHEQAMLEQNGNTLQRYLPEERIIMHSDPHKLRQALSHILNNAARFTKGGLIMVRAKVVGNRVEIQIEDTGEGMSNHQLDQLFKSFANADNTNRRKNEGLGLSLATAHQLISLLGGSIGVNSTIGAGSVFTVQLPAKILEE